jgi:predicted  nucleic acid-binding Zn-ribbon protein
MPKRAQILYALQRIDIQLAIRKRRYRQIEANLGESEALRTAREALKQAQEEQSQWQATLRERELEARHVANKLQTDERRLYSGEVTNPRDLQDLQKEVQYLKRRSANLEEKQLEAMMSTERATTQAAVANEEFVVVESAWKSENGELVQEFDTLKRELAQLLAQRKAVAKRIPRRDLEEYAALQRICKGRAVVGVKDGVCRACNVEVPKRDLERAQTTEVLYYCSGCERILYVPEGP